MRDDAHVVSNDVYGCRPGWQTSVLGLVGPQGVRPCGGHCWLAAGCRLNGSKAHRAHGALIPNGEGNWKGLAKKAWDVHRRAGG